MGEADKLFTDGEAYERLMGRWSREVGKLFLDWLHAPNNLSWLDVGCGNGAFTEEIIARFTPAAVTAVDPSDDQLAYARTRPGVKMTNFQVGDAQNLPFADRTFDIATMALVISFCDDGSGDFFFAQSGQGGCGNGARGATRRVGCGLHVGRSRGRNASAPNLPGIGINGYDVRARTQHCGLRAGCHARLVEKRRA